MQVQEFSKPSRTLPSKSGRSPISKFSTKPTTTRSPVLSSRHAHRSQRLRHPVDLRHGQHQQYGKTVHVGDSRAQCQRTFRTSPVCWQKPKAAPGKTSCAPVAICATSIAIAAFNRGAPVFYQQQGLDPVPASTGIQAKLCRPDLLVEMQTICHVPPELPR